MPTSVLLAVLAAAGLLALAPALVRRYDATERLVAERALSTARVLQRQRRRRSVPGRVPVNAAPRAATPTAVSEPHLTVDLGSLTSRRGTRLALAPATPARRPVRRTRRRHTTSVHRRRRVFAALLLLNVVELIGVALVSPGFWIGFSVSALLLAAYVVHLRNRAIQLRRRRAAEAREAAWLAARQAEVRREQARRAATRRETQRRLAEQREAVRRAAQGEGWTLPAAVGGDTPGPTLSFRRTSPLRGRPYQAGATPSPH